MKTNTDLAALTAAFLARGGEVKRVAEGQSTIADAKAARKAELQRRRARREAADQRREDLLEYQALCREAATFR